MFNLRPLALLASLALTLGTAPSIFADASQFKFTNTTGEKADDLHIEFNRGVTWEGATPEQEVTEDAFKEASAKGKSEVNLAAGITGDGVEDTKSVVITFEYDGTKPKVKNYRWTNANKLKPTRNDFISMSDAGQVTTIIFDGDASGDGEYLILLDDQEYFFNTEEDETGIETAARFSDWFLGLEYAEILDHQGDLVDVTSRSYGLGYSVLVEVVTPDSSQGLICESSPIWEEPSFTRGDIDGDGIVVTLIDVIFLLERGFGDANIDPPCVRAADVNQDDRVNYIVDSLALLYWQYGGEDHEIPYPGPGECGTDPDSPLTCESGGTDTDSDGLCDAGDADF